jgi:hypothetical protein
VRDSTLDFAGQDCRNRSFRNQNLNGANFQGADLRGCDFRGAQLQNANFEGAIVGQSRRQRVCYWLVCISAGVVAINEFATLLFDVLGRTWDDPLWKTMFLLVGTVGVGGTLTLISYNPRLKLKRVFQRALQTGIAALTSSLVGLALILSFLGDYISDRQAALGAIAVGLMGGLLHRNCPQIIVQLGFQVWGLALAYGFAFWLGANATLFLSVESLGWGGLMTAITLIYLWFCWQAIQRLLTEIQSAPGTLFRNANLVGVQFTNAMRTHCDVRGARY